MALHDSMRTSVAPFLRPGETVQVVFGYGKEPDDGGPCRGVGSEPQPMASADRRGDAERILVLDAGPSGRTATEVLAELPRSSRLGPPFGALMHVLPLEGERLRVPRRFVKDVKAADSLLQADT